MRLDTFVRVDALAPVMRPDADSLWIVNQEEEEEEPHEDEPYEEEDDEESDEGEEKSGGEEQ